MKFFYSYFFGAFLKGIEGNVEGKSKPVWIIGNLNLNIFCYL